MTLAGHQLLHALGRRDSDDFYYEHPSPLSPEKARVLHRCSVQDCWAWLEVDAKDYESALWLCHEHLVKLDGPCEDYCPLCKREAHKPMTDYDC
jgi:hypothetical protein